MWQATATPQLLAFTLPSKSKVGKRSPLPFTKPADFIFCQLWHCGRISHPAYQPNGKFPPAPSPIGAREVESWKPDWSPADKIVKPKEMSPDDIDFTVEDYRKGHQSRARSRLRWSRSPRRQWLPHQPVSGREQQQA